MREERSWDRKTEKGTFLRPLCLKPNHENELCPAIMTLGPGLPLVNKNREKINILICMSESEERTETSRVASSLVY